ncbi:putative Polyadenylate-binding protein [Giardia muris]|uniref:Putative Polyadenylate-binding protein n=1 Tax=Giardia muris TaxID=5742 RepID=A0A4Z1T1Q5_GIAMU|nr:putative Polyadenylate-binding protein [Giardia muris]|eukprot:TNJ27863.1 putative Polyadenylate-binding protein [Giardia muris]
MSRLFVRNLPKRATEADVRAHFAPFGTLSDVRLVMTEDGKSRRVAYVGYVEQNAGERAMSQLNNTYVLTSRISIDRALTRNDLDSARRLRREEREREHAERLARRPQGAREIINAIKTEGGERLAEFLKIRSQKHWEDAVPDAGVTLGEEDEMDAIHEEPACEPLDDHGQNEADAQKEEYDSSRIKIVGLSPLTTEEALRNHFARYGAVRDTIVCMDRLTSQPNGVAFVTFELPEVAHQARGHPEIIIDGKIVRVFMARSIPVRERPFMVKGRDTHNKLAWNPSFLRTETVASTVAQRLGIEKTEVASNAVGLAVAEATLVGEAEEALYEKGVLIGEKAYGIGENQRSRVLILCKNLTADLKAEDLAECFSAHGLVLRSQIVYPGFALVEMGSPQDARRAFNMLAFKRIGPQKVPLFLEFALLSNQTNVEANATGPDVQTDDTVKNNPVTVHLRNVSFDTSPERVEAVARELQGFLSCHMVLHAQGHRGFGFVEFRSKETAERAIDHLSRVVLDGYKWEAALARARAGRDDQVDDDATTKLIIKNLAFQASEKELRQLVSQFGRVVSFRAPKKIDGTLRGFAFVQYATEKEAGAALRALRQTHFYGRHLVPQFSDDMGLDMGCARGVRA